MARKCGFDSNIKPCKPRSYSIPVELEGTNNMVIFSSSEMHLTYFTDAWHSISELRRNPTDSKPTSKLTDGSVDFTVDVAADRSCGDRHGARRAEL